MKEIQINILLYLSSYSKAFEGNLVPNKYSLYSDPVSIHLNTCSRISFKFAYWELQSS
jgi:hypothetical protein